MMQEEDAKPKNLQDLPVYDLSRCACHSSPVWMKEGVESLLLNRRGELIKILLDNPEDSEEYLEAKWRKREIEFLLDSADKK